MTGELIDDSIKENILDRLCYTELVYQRINKKLRMDLSIEEIEKFVYSTVFSADCVIYKNGKNYYAYNEKANTRITINSFNYRVITADRILK